MNKYLYYNDLHICIGSAEGETTQNQEIVHYVEGADKTLKKAIHEFLSAGNTKDLFVKTTDIDGAFEAIKEHFKYIVAAGGLIQKKDQYLFIKRLGKWDLPKGKLDKGESIEHAAIRECEEECAVEGLKILKQIQDTYHIYEHKKGFALKATYWFHMETSSAKELKAQTEEHIEEARWFSLEEIRTVILQNTYVTIENLVRGFFSL
jgi:ADP-ribose pyrophosphatase YjhB (NUDIX family)